MQLATGNIMTNLSHSKVHGVLSAIAQVHLEEYPVLAILRND